MALGQRSNNVVELRPVRQSTKERYLDDDIFFSKSKVKIGTRFTNVGQRQQGAHWEVTKITSEFITGVGTYRPRTVDGVRLLNDRVTLHCKVTGETRTTSFHNLCYSAIWRLV